MRFRRQSLLSFGINSKNVNGLYQSGHMWKFSMWPLVVKFVIGVWNEISAIRIVLRCL